MKILVDEIKLKLLLEQKKAYIGKKVTWDALLSAVSFLFGVALASYHDILCISGVVWKTVFVGIGVFFTAKAVIDLHKSHNDTYSYTELLKDIDSLNEITHNHSIIAIKDTFNDYPNRYLQIEDALWGCKLFLHYRDNVNNERYIKSHLSSELKIPEDSISVRYITQYISEKVSGSDGENKVYRHCLFYVTITRFPEQMKADTFQIDGKQYCWCSISDLEKDSDAMSKNKDIIGLVKDSL